MIDDSQAAHEAAVQHVRTLERSYRAREQILYADEMRLVADLAEVALVAKKALQLAEDVLSRYPDSTNIWPNGMHPNEGIRLIRSALAAIEDAKKG